MRRPTLKTALKCALNDWTKHNKYWAKHLFSHTDKLSVFGIKSDGSEEKLYDAITFYAHLANLTHIKIEFESAPVVILKFAKNKDIPHTLKQIQDANNYYVLVWDKDQVMLSEYLKAKEIFGKSIFEIAKSITLPVISNAKKVKIYDGVQVQNILNTWAIIKYFTAQNKKVMCS